MTADVLAIGAHPDDVEIGCGGTIRKLVNQGYLVAACDLSEGELGSRGSVELRSRETERASEILGIHQRINLGIPDGNIANTKENQARLIRVIRSLRPGVLLISAPECRHPDHADAARLCIDAAFYSGLRRIEVEGDPWRPKHVLHYMQSLTFEPTLVVDVSDTWEERMAAVRAYGSQFHNPGYVASEDEPETYISNVGFLRFIEARARQLGYRVGADFGEGFLYHQGPYGVDDLVAALSGGRRA